MRDLKDAKDIYDHIVVPEELDHRLREALENTPTPQKKTANVVKFSRWAATAAAALFLCFTVGLNTSESFAMEMSELPIIGTVAKVLTVRSYETTTDNTTTTVEVPEVQVEEAAAKEVQNAITDINTQIQTLVDEFTAQKYAEIDEYKEAFLETGGTEEEWAERSIDINVNYEVKHQSETTLSLLVDAWISWFNFQEERHFYNIDLVTGKELTLVDLLGEDAYEYAADQVYAQMQERIAEDPEGLIYWGINDSTDGIDGFDFIGVSEETPFYINSAGNVVISYNKYDAGPGYMGVQEFEIPAR
ncbi:MAG: DUF3298 domain-containing protein [Lachnospiraceae bacterium]|nr:DUF3298 domain-containing protein [Lachnospiraceae bacterium]